MPNSTRKPKWLKVKLSTTPHLGRVERAISAGGLHTVCQEALCPNRLECYNRATATFLLMGDVCSRRCTFCNVAKGKPAPLNPSEPENVARAAAELSLDFVVLTSVTRDDLPDGGAAHIAATISAVKAANPKTGVEVLAPDFKGQESALATVLEAGPEVFNHNVETVPRLYPALRPEAEFGRSVRLLARAKELKPGLVTKTGLMLGLGESDDELRRALAELVAAGVDLLTLGQYLAPSKSHHPVAEYVSPERFEAWRNEALEMGFADCAAGPLVRSSYRAKELYQRAGGE